MKKQLLYLSISAGLVAGRPGPGQGGGATGDKPAKDEAPPKTAASRIAQVTVYPNSALVTREVEVPAGIGSMELVVNPLPEHTIGSTLYSEGGDGIRVLTTRFRTRPVKEDTREEVRKLEDEGKKLRQTQETLQGDIKALSDNMALLGKLENFTAASTTHATEKGKMDSDATIALAKYLMEGRTEKAREVVKLQQQMQLNTEQMEFVVAQAARADGRLQQDRARRRHRGGQGQQGAGQGPAQLPGGCRRLAPAVQDPRRQADQGPGAARIPGRHRAADRRGLAGR